MKIQQRQKKIIEILLEQEEYITIGNLAKQVSLSSRTVRNELNKLKPLLENLNLDLETKAGSGVILKADASTKLSLRAFINQGRFLVDEKYGYSPQQRQRYIMVRLLTNADPLKVSDFQKELFISRATAFNDVKIAEKQFLPYKIKLLRYKNSGIAVKGRERHIRTCLLDLMLTDEDVRLFKLLLNGQEIKKTTLFFDLELDSKFLRRYFQNLSLLQWPNKFQISMNDKVEMLLRMFISIKRYKQGHEVKLSDELMNELRTSHTLSELESMLYPIEKYFQTRLSEVEKRYIQVFLLAADGSYFVTKEEQEYAKDLMKQCLFDWSNRLNIDLTQDQQLVKELYSYMLQAQVRFMFGIRFEFPLAKEIKLRYPEFFPMIEKSLKKLEFRYDFKSSDAEISSLVLILLTALKRQTGRLKILLFFQHEEPIVYLLEEELKQNFANITIEIERNYHLLHKRDLANYDLLISGTTLDFDIPISVLTIHPLLKSKDLAGIQEKLYELRQKKFNHLLTS